MRRGTPHSLLDKTTRQQPQQPQQPQQLQQPVIPSVPSIPVPPSAMTMNWSYFKPEFSGQPEEDTETHIVRMIDWMETHNFAAGQRVQRFPLNPAGEARLWYWCIHLFQGIWEALEERFRTQFSKIGNTREQFISCMEILSF